MVPTPQERQGVDVVFMVDTAYTIIPEAILGCREAKFSGKIYPCSAAVAGRQNRRYAITITKWDGRDERDGRDEWREWGES